MGADCRAASLRDDVERKLLQYVDERAQELLLCGRRRLLEGRM